MIMLFLLDKKTFYVIFTNKFMFMGMNIKYRYHKLNIISVFLILFDAIRVMKAGNGFYSNY